jgi:hypothetical protein
VEFFEKVKKKVEMFNTHVFNTKVIHNETELKWTPFVAPETRRGSSFVEAFGDKAGSKEIISKDTSLGKTVAALANFKVDPAIAVPTNEVVFLDEFFWDVGKLDANVFWFWHRGVQIEVFEVNGAEPCTLPGEDTVEEKLDEFEQGCVGANVARITDFVTTYGDSGSVRVILLRSNFTDDHGVADFLALVGWDVLVVDEEEGVGTRYPLLCWRRAGTDALAESAQLVSIGGIPSCFVTWVTTKLAMFKGFTCRRIQNG